MLRITKVSFCIMTLFVSWLGIAYSEDSTDAIAQETQEMKQSLDSKVQELIARPEGAFDQKYSEEGYLLQVKIKGGADVPTSMRASAADRYAREKAHRQARAAFVKYLEDNVLISESSAGGIELVTVNKDEASESVEGTLKTYNSYSNAILKGLVTLMDHIEGEGETRVCTVVLGWSKKSFDAANRLKTDMAKKPDTPAKAPTVTSTSSKPPVDPKNDSKGNTETVTRVSNLDDF